MATTMLPRRPASGRAPRRHRGVWALLAAVVAAGLVVGGVRLGRRIPGPASPTCTVTGPTRTLALDPTQAQNASIVAAVGRRLGLPDHAVTVALAAALQESQLRDLTYGDRDSVGLFQQRPSQGWGTHAELLDPAYAAAAFYGGLLRVGGWASMNVTDAAQAVQRSAAPSAYAAWEGEARAVASALTGEVPAGLTCRLPTFAGATPALGALADALATEMGVGVAVPARGVARAGTRVLAGGLDTKAAWQVAAWAVAHAEAYHLRAVTTAGETWTASGGRWAPGGSGSAGGVDVVGGP